MLSQHNSLQGNKNYNTTSSYDCDLTPRGNTDRFYLKKKKRQKNPPLLTLSIMKKEKNLKEKN